MRARYVYSACIVVDTEDLSVCIDPWMTPGAFDGSWFQFPPIAFDPIATIGKVEAIFITHIHPDHYDPVFLHEYMVEFPDTELLIGPTDPPYLLNKMRADGFDPQMAQAFRFGTTEITAVPNRAYGDDIDVGLTIACGDRSVIDLNDCPFDSDQVTALKDACPGAIPTLAFLPYAGAGPWPQTYHYDEPEMAEHAEWKKQWFLDLYCRYVDALDPGLAVPFAGLHVLGGTLAPLNRLRGMADATEAAALRPGCSAVLADGGHAFVDLESMLVSDIRKEPYDPDALTVFLNTVRESAFDYEHEIVPCRSRPLPVFPLLQTAVAAARRRSPVHESCWICLSTDDDRSWFAFDVAGDGPVVRQGTVQDLSPRMEIRLDQRYLFGLVSRLYHWNNAELGSHLKVTRVPDIHRRDVHSFLHRLHV